MAQNKNWGTKKLGNNQANEVFMLTILAKHITFLHIWHWVQITFD
jgi:hypothetical protein